MCQRGCLRNWLLLGRCWGLCRQCSRDSHVGGETGIHWLLSSFHVEGHSMIPSIFNGFICDSHSSLSTSRLFPLFRAPRLDPKSPVNHKDSPLGNMGRPSKPANAPVPETRRHSYPWGKGSTIPGPSRLLSRLSSLGFISSRGWEFGFSDKLFFILSLSPACRLFSLSGLSLFPWKWQSLGASWTAHSTHLNLNSSKKQGCRQRLQGRRKWHSAKHRMTKNFIFNGFRLYPGSYKVKTNSNLKTQSVEINAQSPEVRTSLLRLRDVSNMHRGSSAPLLLPARVGGSRKEHWQQLDCNHDGALTARPSAGFKMGSLLGLCNFVKLNLTNE